MEGRIPCTPEAGKCKETGRKARKWNATCEMQHACSYSAGWDICAFNHLQDCNLSSPKESEMRLFMSEDGEDRKQKCNVPCIGYRIKSKWIIKYTEYTICSICILTQKSPTRDLKIKLSPWNLGMLEKGSIDGRENVCITFRVKVGNKLDYEQSKEEVVNNKTEKYRRTAT